MSLGPTLRKLIDSDIARASTLPAQFYKDPALAEEEKRRIFLRTWQIMGHIRQVQNPGDYITINFLGEPLLIVRNNKGELKGFYNVCKHRAGPPAEGCGSRKVFRCGYHGWTYSLDGALLNAPEFDGVQDFSKEKFGLAPIRIAEWEGLIFVNLDSNAEPLIAALRELPEQAAQFKFHKMRLYERRIYEMGCNWKTYIDNYLEGYHLPSVHPGLNRELDYNAYTVETYPNLVRQFSPIRGAQAGDAAPRRYQEAREDLTTDYFWVYPNWMLNCYPDNVSLNIVLPVSPERSIAIFEWYFLEEALKTQAPAKTVAFSDEIQIEDVRICEIVQKNLQSNSYDRGRYSVKQERGLHHFHSLYVDAMSR